MMRRGRAVKHLVKCLLPVVEQRMKGGSQDSKQVSDHALISPLADPSRWIFFNG